MPAYNVPAVDRSSLWRYNYIVQIRGSKMRFLYHMTGLILFTEVAELTMTSYYAPLCLMVSVSSFITYLGEDLSNIDLCARQKHISVATGWIL